MRKLVDLTKKKKKEIYNDVLKVLDEHNLSKARRFLQSKTTLNDRLDWLIKFKRFYDRNYQSEELLPVELQIIKKEFKADYSTEELRTMILREIRGSIQPTLLSAMNTYKRLLRSLDKHFLILEEKSPFTLVKRKKGNTVLNKNINYILGKNGFFGLEENVNYEMDEKGTPILDEKGNPVLDKNGDPLLDKNRTPIWDKNGNSLLINPIKTIDPQLYLEKYMREMIELIDVLIESFTERKTISKAIPDDISPIPSPGRFPDYPVRKMITLAFWEKHEKTIIKEIKLDIYPDFDAKNIEESELNKYSVPAPKIVKKVKQKLNGILNHIPDDTIKEWLGIKRKKFN